MDVQAHISKAEWDRGSNIIRMLSIVSEPVARMEYTQVINELNIALLEIKSQGELLAEEM